MQFYSLNNRSTRVNFKEAVIRGIAPDKGLYFPAEIQPIAREFFDQIHEYSNNELAHAMIEQFVGNEIPEAALKTIIKDTLNFDFPLVKIEKDVFSLELFHGPTMAFKDVGGRFMARCLSYFNREQNNEVTVLVATSGD
jgi:threonine synthase